MSFWKKKDNIIITACVVLFFMGLAVWFDLCCVRAAFFQVASTSNTNNPMNIPFLDKDQKQLTLSQFKGKPLIINLWATWCSVCVRKMSTFNNFVKKFQDSGGQALAISQDKGGISAIRAYYTRNGYENLPIYIESTNHLMHAFGARGLPTAVFIDAKGNIVHKIEGGIDWESPEVEAVVEQLFGMKLSH